MRLYQSEKASVLRPEDGFEGQFRLITKLYSCTNTRLYIEAYCRLLVEDSRLSAEESAVMKARHIAMRVKPEATHMLSNTYKCTISGLALKLATWMGKKPVIPGSITSPMQRPCQCLKCPALTPKLCKLESLASRSIEGLRAVLNRCKVKMTELPLSLE